MRHNPTTHSISWFVERDREQTLVMQPSFQRKLVWKDPQKSNLVESILLDLPIPEIYIHAQTDSTGYSEYTVVDGQQRISSILEFAGIGGRQQFELSGLLDADSPWAGYRFDDLSEDEKSAFFGRTMAVRELEGASSDEIEGLFKRINKYITPLNPQELRNATYKGPFLRLSETLAEETFWSENGLATPQAIRRMRDIEFVSDLLIGAMHGPQSGSPKVLDEFYGAYEDYEHEIPQQREARRRFFRTLQTIQEVLPNLKDTRWSNKTDFYSLFVSAAELLRNAFLPGENYESLRMALRRFADEIAEYQGNEHAEVPDAVQQYVEAMRRGSSDKNRRGTRHLVMLGVIEEFFRESEA